MKVPKAPKPKVELPKTLPNITKSLPKRGDDVATLDKKKKNVKKTLAKLPKKPKAKPKKVAKTTAKPKATPKPKQKPNVVANVPKKTFEQRWKEEFGTNFEDEMPPDKTDKTKSTKGTSGA
ncbi:hypothetical protein ACFLZH_02120 [Patescibacteria group bacterium]